MTLLEYVWSTNADIGIYTISIQFNSIQFLFKDDTFGNGTNNIRFKQFA